MFYIAPRIYESKLVRIDMVQYLLKLLLKQIFLAVYHDFHSLLAC